MNFLHTLLLWFLPLALIPLILHVLTLFRARTVELATYRFLFDSFQHQRRQLRFQEALLTFLRTLFLLGLVLLVCRPVVRHGQSLFRTGGGSDRIMLIDASSSMNRRSAGRTAFQCARTAAIQLAASLPHGDRLSVLSVGARPEEILRRTPQGDESVRRRIEALECGDARGNWLAAFAALDAAGLFASRPTLYLLTDGQSLDWREARERGLGGLVPDGTQVFFVRVGDPAGGDNFSVVGDAPLDGVAVAGLPLLLQARLLNPGRAAADVTVRLILNDQEADRATLNLKAGGAAVATLACMPSEPGPLCGRFEIGMDDFPDDNAFFFALHVEPRVPVLLVNGHPDRDPLADAALYLRSALHVRPEEHPEAAGLLPARSFLQALQIEEIPAAGVSPERLARSSVAILANVGRMELAQWIALQKFVAAGGGLLVFPGDRSDVFDYNRFLFKVAGAPEACLSPFELANIQGEAGKQHDGDRLTALDVHHPALSVFDDLQSSYFAGVSVFHHFQLRLQDGVRGGRVLARFARSDAPALVENRYGEGIVIVCAFPADNRWSNLPLKPEWVPLVLRLVSYVQRRAELHAPRLASTDGRDEVSVPDGWAPATGQLTGPAGRSTPLVFLRGGNRRSVAQLSGIRQKGFYKIQVSGCATGAPKTAAAVLAVNLPPEESDVQTLTIEELRGLLPKARVKLVDAGIEAQQRHGGLGEEREVWRPLIFLLFAVMLVEFMVSTFVGGSNDQPGWRVRLRRAWSAWRLRSTIPEAGIP
ncbi:MAG: VWA domain-containing protein [bacterium]